jgi:HPt (histidine-containing phosphotransfer) domain-containing protein
MVLNRWIRDRQSEDTLRAAESRAPEQAEQSGEGSLPKQGNGQGESADMDRWLLAHPVEGVDIAAAFSTYGGGAAFMPILKSFVSRTPSLLSEMVGSLENSLSDYTIRVHALKGACSVICAKDIAALAGELETAAREGNLDFVRSRHGELEQMLLPLLDKLKALLAEWAASLPKPDKEQRAEPDRELLARLSAAAGEFNCNKIEEVLKELERYQYEKGEALIQWLREQAEDFAYDAVHRRLEDFLRDTHKEGANCK